MIADLVLGILGQAPRTARSLRYAVGYHETEISREQLAQVLEQLRDAEKIEMVLCDGEEVWRIHSDIPMETGE